MNDNESQDPKIIVDDDWKSKAEAEKAALEALRAKRDAATGESPEADKPADDDKHDEANEASGESATSKQSAPDESARELPPASFAMHVTAIATQAMSSLGFLPDESGQPQPARLPVAKHLIDTLAMLQEKTKRNLTGEEHEMLKSILHELRMAYVQAAKPR